MENGKIYKLICNNTGKCYYGSTVFSLDKRLKDHEYQYKSYLKNKSKYVSSFEILAGGNYDIELFENFPCYRKQDLLNREGYYMRNNECVNKMMTGRSREEYREIFKENNPDYHKNYYYKYKHSDKHKEYTKKRLLEKINCDCGSVVSRANYKKHLRSVGHKRYVETGKLNVKLTPEERRLRKNEARRKTALIKINCECGAIVNKNNYKSHCKNKKHLNYLKTGKPYVKVNNDKPIVCDCGSKLSKGNYGKHLKTLKHINYINSL